MISSFPNPHLFLSLSCKFPSCFLLDILWDLFKRNPYSFLFSLIKSIISLFFYSLSFLLSSLHFPHFTCLSRTVCDLIFQNTFSLNHHLHFVFFPHLITLLIFILPSDAFLLNSITMITSLSFTLLCHFA